MGRWQFAWCQIKDVRMAWQQHGHGLSLLQCSTSQERTLLAAAAILSLHTLTTRLNLDHLIMWFFKRKGSSGLSSSSTAEKVAHGILMPLASLPLSQAIPACVFSIWIMIVLFCRGTKWEICAHYLESLCRS